MKSRPLLRLTLALAFAAFSLHLRAADSPREHLSLDAGWKFHLGDEWPDALNFSKAGAGKGPVSEKFDDASWRQLDLPHDWAIELPFDQRAEKGHGFKALGPDFPTNSVGWYRRTFELPKEDSGKRIWLTFDGVMHDATVCVNGWLVRRHEGGYYPFREDVTDIVKFGGTNLISVRVDATKSEGWFYEGAGIYRHVWLDKTAPAAIAPDGIFVYSQFSNNIPTNKCDIKVHVTLDKQTHDHASLSFQIINPDGGIVLTSKPIEGTRTNYILDSIRFGKDPETVRSWPYYFKAGDLEKFLWSPENPKLYKLITTVSVDGKIVDRKETEFGIRTVGFDKDKGFLLNGQPYELKGTCNHQDHAGVGAAIPDALQDFRVKQLKEMGGNAIRTSHNPPTPELLDACDRLGMLVMDEGRLLGSDSENLRKWDDQIRRDRNHPSVAIWSIANEEFHVQDTPQAGNVARTMQNYVKQLDPTRPVTYASPEGNVFKGVNSVIQVRGWNYHVGKNADQFGRDMAAYRAAHPDQPNVGTEQASTVGTRGIYENDKVRGYVGAYDDNAPKWANTAEEWYSIFAARPWLSGGFVWTGFDYRGEPTPYGWPCISSHFGVLDTCGFPKDNFYYYQSWWTTNTVLHLLPHWNWPGKEGQEIRVDALSNCKSVELFLNGASLGKQDMKPDSKLSWRVKYAPGVLSAKGFDAGGKVIAETKVETTGEPVQIQLTPDRKIISADGADVAVFTVAALDAQGRVVPVAQNKINFHLEGAGKILGVGNGDPSCHEPDTFAAQPGAQWSRSLFNGLAQVIVQSARNAGEIQLTANAAGLQPATSVVTTQPGAN